MSLNLGTEAMEAARELRGHPSWKTVVMALHGAATRAMHTAMDAPLEDRSDLVVYARAIRDLYVSLTAAADGVKPQQVEKPMLAMPPSLGKPNAR